ncbi:SDR family oxidoreductase [Piscinibacter koreensis]|uniref:SDR family oxidoreductase n=1 Tax=Piscinibacter koreensis TaxID=2742824 RepID=A0A7Y6NS81_9BURK|nr:SDR family oxidoreductase [Schlegelella koreensis]NUZ08386.1 SDR family oxidoreductase [Schlegelella koreensis]
MTQKRVAIVTGAGSGIGKCASLALLRDGYHVGLVGRRREMLEKTAAESGAEDRALVLAADITRDADVERVFSKVKSKFGRLDVLFNNAGMGAPAVPMEDLPIETFREVVNLNLVAMFMCTQHAIRIMKAQTPKGGRIINNGSLSAHVPRALSVAYSATKHAVTGLTKSISLDGRDHDIAGSQIDIGNALTELATGMSTEPMMDVKYAGAAVLHMANLPLDVNVQSMAIMATKMPFIGRG